MNSQQDGPENRSGRLEEEKNIFLLPGIEMFFVIPTVI
jgi:hypothetical protein